jgi:hypothetical protein
MTKKPTTYFFKKAVKIPIYGGYFLMIFSNDGERIARATNCKEALTYVYAHSFHNFVYKDYESFAVALNFWNLKSRVDIGTIVHEVNHVGNRILQSRGVERDWENDEAESYLKGWLGETVEKFMLECKIV